MKKFIAFILIISLCLTTISISIFADTTNIRKKDKLPPSIKISVVSTDSSATKLQITSKDDNSGVKSLLVDDVEYKGNNSGKAFVVLREDDVREFVNIVAVDYAGNESPTHIVCNPYFIGQSKPMIDDKILKSDLGNRVSSQKGKDMYIYPIETTETTTTVSKYFEINSDKELENIITQEFDNDSNYSVKEVKKYQPHWVHVKNFEINKELISDSDDYKTLVSSLDKDIIYKGKDGFVGKLDLDYSSVDSAVNDVITSGYTSTIKRTFPGLSNQDTSLVPKTIYNGGTTYYFNNINWDTDYEEQHAEYATTYSATVVYSRYGTTSSVKDYKTGAMYKGKVSAIRDKNMLYKITFDIGDSLDTTVTSEISGSQSSNEADFATAASNTKDDSRPIWVIILMLCAILGVTCLIVTSKGEKIKKTFSNTKKPNKK